MKASSRGRETPADDPLPHATPVVDAWTAVVYETESGSCPYRSFYSRLDDYCKTVLDIAIEQVLLKQGHNVCSTEWGKALGEGLYEFRVRRTLSVLCEAAGIEIPTGLPSDQKILLRVFFAVEGVKIVVLLSGYDKGKDDSVRRQAKEIALARSLLKQHKAEQKPDRKS